MTRPIFSASTLPIQLPQGPLLLFIQQAQLTMLYRERSPERTRDSDPDARVAA